MNELRSGDIHLRELCPADNKVLAYLANNRKIFDNVRDYFPHPYSLADADSFINLCVNQIPAVTFGIEFKAELAGVVGIVPQSDVYRLTAEIGYWIGEPYWNKGIASTAVNILTDYTFKSYDFIRIYSGVFSFNKASQRVLEKCGYTLECIFKNSVIKNGVICDEYRYARLK